MLATYSAKFIIGVILLWLGLCTNQSIYAQNLVKDPGIDSVNCSHFQNSKVDMDHWADPIDSPCYFGALIGTAYNNSCFGTDKLKYWSSYKIEGKSYLANANGLRYNYDYRPIRFDSCKPDFLVHIPILFRDYMLEEKCALDSAYTPVFGELYRNKIIPGANYYVSFYTQPKAYLKKDIWYGNNNSLYDYGFISTSSYGLKFLDHAPDTNLDARFTRNYVDGQYDIKNTNGYLEDSIVFKIKGNYLATGNERFLAVGCFDMPQNLPYSYVDSYYVDKRYANDSLIFIDTVYYDPDYRKVLGRYHLVDWPNRAVYYTDNFTMIPQPILPADTTICMGDTLWLQPQIAKGGYYEWQNGQVKGRFPVSQSGTYWVMNYSAYDTTYDSIQVNVQAAPKGSHLYLCDDDDTACVMLPIYSSSIEWLHNGSQKPNMCFNSAGKYVYKYNYGSCQGFDTILVQTLEPPSKLVSDTQYCALDAWMPTKPLNADTVYWNVILPIQQTGNYIRTSEIKSCIYKEQVNVKIWPDLPNEQVDTLLCEGMQVIKYYGKTDERDSIIINLATNERQIAWYDGCDTNILAINVGLNPQCDCPLFIPNAITANNDGVNDTFIITSSCRIEDTQIRIFNRWGQQIYNSNNWKWHPINKSIGLYYVWISGYLNNGTKKQFIQSYTPLYLIE